MNTNSPGRPKVNPDYDPVGARDKMAQAVAELYLHPKSNMDTDEEGHATMKELQDHFGLTMTKIRKLLVTAGVYHFYAFQNQKRLIDDYMIKFVVEHEMLG